MDNKDLIGIVAVLLNFVAYAGYFRGIFAGSVRPHFFSWFVWAVLTGIGYAAQVAGGGGPGSWVTGVSALVCAVIAALALKYGEKDIKRSDWIAFLGSLAAIPLWIMTKDPLYSVFLITIIDAVAFWPTFRKSWLRPDEESVFTFAASSLKFALGIAALTEVNLVTAFYTGSLVVMNGVFVVMVLYRRRRLSVA